MFSDATSPEQRVANFNVAIQNPPLLGSLFFDLQQFGIPQDQQDQAFTSAVELANQRLSDLKQSQLTAGAKVIISGKVGKRFFSASPDTMLGQREIECALRFLGSQWTKSQ
jgi:hypothetical protein